VIENDVVCRITQSDGLLEKVLQQLPLVEAFVTSNITDCPDILTYVVNNLSTFISDMKYELFGYYYILKHDNKETVTLDNARSSIYVKKKENMLGQVSVLFLTPLL